MPGQRNRKDSNLQAQFFRITARSGKKKAILAVAASMLTPIYHTLKYGTEHHDLGADHFDRCPTEIKTRRLAAQIAKLGYQVELRPLQEAA